jgi:hypothetical protein
VGVISGGGNGFLKLPCGGRGVEGVNITRCFDDVGGIVFTAACCCGIRMKRCDTTFTWRGRGRE